MGLLDDLSDVVKGPLSVVSGVVNGVSDARSLAKDISDGNWGNAFKDGYKLSGDLSDIAEGLSGLGFSTGPIPTSVSSQKNLIPAESKILWAAQQAIDGMKKTTGSGQPAGGDEFRSSSERLENVKLTLIDAEPHTDRWDGTASQIYTAVNASHRRVASLLQTADKGVADVLETEAGQVTRTRETLDDQIQWLKSYDLATCWMEATGPGRIAKMALDATASAGALAIAGGALGILVKNSIENASRIREHLHDYATAAGDTSGNPDGGCEVFTLPDKDHELAIPDNVATPLPAPNSGTTPPSRSKTAETYTVPSPEEPIEYGPPATPYGAPGPAVPTPAAPIPPAAATTTAPATLKPPTPARPVAPGAPARPATPSPATAGAHTTYAGERAPVDAHADDPRPATTNRPSVTTNGPS